MKVLQINATFNYKSTGTIVSDIGKYIAEYGNDPYFAFQSAQYKPARSIKVGNKIDSKIHAVLSRIFGKQGFYSSIPTLKLIKYIKKNNIDIVHLHNLHSNFINISILLKYLSKKNIPTVITFHDCWWFTGKCFHYIDCSCTRFISGCGKCPKKNNAPKSIFFDRSKWCWKTKKKLLLSIPRLYIVGCSKWICSESKKSFLKDVPILNINNGVNIEIFKPIDVNAIKKELFLEDKFVILGMANKWFLDENKKLLSAIKMIKNCKVIVVGCSDKQIVENREENSDFILVGYINDLNEMAKYYNMADVFVNPTHADTLPTVNMESICCGTPVITFSSGGSGELVDEETGIVVEENDFEGVINGINTIRKTPLKDCWKRGAEKFDNRKSYFKYISLYENILKRR